MVSDLGLKRKVLGQVFFVRISLDLLISFSCLVVFHCLCQLKGLNLERVNYMHNNMVVFLLTVQNIFIFLKYNFNLFLYYIIKIEKSITSDMS